MTAPLLPPPSPPEPSGPAARRALPGGKVLANGRRLYWWREIVYVVAVQLVYETIRNLNEGGRTLAYDNAVLIMSWQDAIGLNVEESIQDWALGLRPLIIASNYFYGSAYLAVTAFVLIYLYRRHPDRYPLVRNTLAVGTLLGLIGFRLFPLMPPRLLDLEGDGTVYGFVDTLKTYPTFWSFESSAMESISNQYAAMPSLHCGWAFWGAFSLWAPVRTGWGRALLIAYPVLTVVTVIITGNHYWLDAVGGAVAFGSGYLLARWRTAPRGDPLAVPAATTAASP